MIENTNFIALFKDFIDFNEKYCVKVTWIEKLYRQDYSNFLRTYLIPCPLMKVSTNQISFLHSIVLCALKRSLKNKEIKVHYNPNDKKLILKTLFLADKHIQISKNKSKIFKELKQQQLISNWHNFAYVALGVLVLLDKQVKDVSEDIFKKFHEKYKITFIEDEKVPEGQIFKVIFPVEKNSK